MNFNTIPEALQDLKQGKIILVTDDPDRENEGDFICAARKRSTLPGCVPGSIFNFAFPSMVGTSTVAPKAACGTLSRRLYNRSFSSRINSGCGSSSIRINKSPLIPPCRAALPLPFMESCMPSLHRRDIDRDNLIVANDALTITLRTFLDNDLALATTSRASRLRLHLP